ncbi:MAG: hydrogenobyrinic acid a,c-diamide synthase (glutamine-hydrolyzing) [candidate division Zixibacteria bacterium]|nr:hydrogenobyrinic acid a,c-diamide synthase (glutamine-hydrolyzing) [candidate division Zixibacteria bacterium]NIR62647.1 hydrogenobyrinic acid a,c-diamide synthase (glutamine-hydrolyzing) [candidate division Zixibacteria bacterium]NIS15505.1 hydrogenobyrinic acid a,c-diamide synthase (glutamine-hydrolyzing) [candidate division Zixibacteria bacterium]NIS44732.1 hydrogenobyrinic acid a,c-diamide synthase (glutamine-hydrolyzing) [candidate division Zixibacteria bacterium]NIT52024.1 hydrogenobyr
MSLKASKSCPRLVIAGTSGDSGKTLISLGLLAGLRQHDYKVAAFKKGPDYIDPAWLNAASGKSVRNLDTFLVDREKVYQTFAEQSLENGINVIEGNRGLYDGLDLHGSHSTAELAKLLKAPIVLVCNVTKSTRTVAAVVLGMKEMDKEANIAGIILNQVGGKRHKEIVKESIEKTTGIPVLGAIPRVKNEKLLPSRHLGLITPAEYPEFGDLIKRLGNLVSDNVHIAKLANIAHSASELQYETETGDRKSESVRGIKIGYFSDTAFTFYYPENLESLQDLGAELLPISSLENKELPDIDALYIGGGFPETHAERLAENRLLMDAVRKAALDGLPVYAECGGLIYLCNSLTIGESSYPMAGLFDVDLLMNSSPRGHGYSIMSVDQDNPFYPKGTELKGHEFHYTAPSRVGANVKTVMSVTRGSGFKGNRDGLVLKSVWASYLHLHASGEQGWSEALVKLASEYKIDRSISGGGAGISSRKAV